MSSKNIKNNCEITKTTTTPTTGKPILNVPYGSENMNIAARNQLADFANRLGRRGTKITIEMSCRWSELRVWSDTLKPQEQETSEVRKITALAAARIGWTFVDVELTRKRFDDVTANDPSCFKHGTMDEHGVVLYAGETPEQIINKMTLDNIHIPPVKDFTPKGRLKMQTAREAVIQRLVDTAVISGCAARFYLWNSRDPIEENSANEVLNDSLKWTELSNRVRTKLESSDPYIFEIVFGTTKQEALSQ